MLSISERTLQTWRDSGVIKFSRVGRTILYRQEDIDEFLLQNQPERLQDENEDKSEPAGKEDALQMKGGI